MSIALNKNTAIEEIKIKKNKYNLWNEIKKNKDNYLMVAPFMILFLIFMVIPVISSLFLSFTYFNLLQPPKFIGWMNYERLFLEDDVFLICVKNTLIFAFITGPISYFLCLFFAWFINELPPKIRAFMTFVFYAPSISGNLFVIWGYIFSGDSYGFINGTLMKLGILDEARLWLTNPNYNLKVIILVQLWLSLGASFLAFIAGLQGIDRNLYEAAAIDGVKNRWQELFFVTLPSMGPQLMFGAVMQISSSFNVAGICMHLAGFPSTDYSADTVVTHILDYGNLRFEMGYASAIATILFIAMIFTKNIITKILSKYN